MDYFKAIATGGLGLLVLTAPPAAGQAACGSESASAVCPSSAVQATTREFLQHRLDRTVPFGPGSQIDKRLKGTAWDPNANGTAPVLVEPDGDGARYSTSLSSFGSWVVRSDREKIEQAKKLAKGDLKLPAAPPMGGHHLDLWMSGRVLPKSGDGSTSEAFTNTVGADYRLSDKLIVGGLVQTDSASETALAAGNGAATGEAYIAGPYVALGLYPGLTLEARTAWGHGTDTIHAAGGTSGLQTERQLSEASLKGNWDWNDWRIAPTAALTVREETAAGTDAGQRQLTFTPKISRTLTLGGGKELQPFVEFRSNLDLEAAQNASDASLLPDQAITNGIGAGATLRSKDDYTLEATTGLEGLNAPESERSVSGKVNLKIPLR